MSIKVAQNDFTRKMNDFDTFTKLPKMYEIWANSLLQKAFNGCPKCNKLPNLVALVGVGNYLKVFLLPLCAKSVQLD